MFGRTTGSPARQCGQELAIVRWHDRERPGNASTTSSWLTYGALAVSTPRPSPWVTSRRLRWQTAWIGRRQLPGPKARATWQTGRVRSCSGDSSRTVCPRLLGEAHCSAFRAAPRSL